MPAAGDEQDLRIARPGFVLLALVLASLAVSSFYIHRSLPNPDEGAVLTNAAKILRGGVFYREIDAYPFPGSYYLLAGAMAIFGEHVTVARWLAAAVFAGVVASLYLAALPLLSRRGATLFGLSLLSLKFLTWPGFSSYLYSDVGFLGGCASIALFLRRGAGATWPLVGAGFAAGIALASKQNIGLYLGAAAGLMLLFPAAAGLGPSPPWRRRFEEFFAYGAGAAVALVPMLGYFALEGVLGEMLYSGFVRPFTGYLPTSGIDFSPMLAWWDLGAVRGQGASPYFVADYWHLLMQNQLPGPSLYGAYWLAGEIFGRLVYTSLPVSIAWFASRWWRAPRAQAEEVPLRMFGLLAIPVVLTAFPRADSFHIFSVYALIALLLLALAHKPAALQRSLSSRVRTVIGCAAVAALLGATGTLAHVRHTQLSHHLVTERADAWVEPADAWVGPVVDFVRREVPEGEALFVYGHEAQLYFLTGRFFPWSFPQLYPGQEGGEDGKRLASLLRETRPRVVLQGVLRWPGVPALPEYAPSLDAFVKASFERDRGFFAREFEAGPPPPAWVMTVRRPRQEPVGDP